MNVQVAESGKKPRKSRAHFKAFRSHGGGRVPVAMVIGVGAVGAAIARVLLSHSDHHVILAGKGEARVNALFDELAQNPLFASRMSVYQFDATNELACMAVCRHLKQQDVRINLLVLAAGKAVLDREGSTYKDMKSWATEENKPNVAAKFVPFVQFASITRSVLLVSSIAAGFKPHQVKRQFGYCAACQLIEASMSEPKQPALGVNYEQVIKIRVPLVQGDTANEFIEQGIVNVDAAIPTPDEYVLRHVLPGLCAAGFCWKP